MASESTGKTASGAQPDLPKKIHFVGIGGIGMSGLAQMFRDLGCAVTGSDRALGHPENERIFAALRKCGAKLFPQDGSVYADGYTPDAIVYSTAIEEDNPDFKCAPPGTRRLHRSEALSLGIGALRGRFTIAVTGTCGKTTVSAWLADALDRIGDDPGMLSGGYVKRFREDGAAGNYRGGFGRDFVIEADESDKSLLNYVPDTALILNIGTDHYSREELAEVFLKFSLSARSCVVMELAAFQEIGPEKFPAGKMVLLFSGDPDAPVSCAGRRVLRLDSYRVADGSAWCAFNGLPEIRLPMPGRHNAMNALAVHTVLTSRGYDPLDALKAVSRFAGVAHGERRAGHRRLRAQRGEAGVVHRRGAGTRAGRTRGHGLPAARIRPAALHARSARERHALDPAARGRIHLPAGLLRGRHGLVQPDERRGRRDLPKRVGDQCRRDQGFRRPRGM